MKKVLILTVIAILALGVMALADTMAYPTHTSGPTCSATTLQVTSNIYVLAGFEATATGYDATFCGASGKLISGTVLLNNDSTDSAWTPSASGVLLASLSVKSNHRTIKVIANWSSVTGPGTIAPSSGHTVMYYEAGSYNYSTGVWTLPAGSSPYSGTAYAYYNDQYIQQWVEAGKYTATLTLTIVPATLNGNGTFNF